MEWSATCSDSIVVRSGILECISEIQVSDTVVWSGVI